MAKKDTITIFLGSEQKLNVNIKPVAEFTADDFDFVVDVYCSPKRTSTKTKSELIRVDEENYVFLLDTNEVGAGEVKAKVTAYIPDYDYADTFRTEVSMYATNIVITKTL